MHTLLLLEVSLDVIKANHSQIVLYKAIRGFCQAQPSPNPNLWVEGV